MELDLDALLSDAVAQQEARDRVAARVLRDVAEQEATFLGALLDLAERGDLVMVRTTGERSHRGVVRAVGRDFIVLQEAGGPPAFVAVSAIASVRSLVASRRRGEDVAGSRPPPVEASLASVLAGLAAARPQVHIGVSGETAALLGELRAVGRDVVTLRLESGERPAVLLPVPSIRDVVLLDL